MSGDRIKIFTKQCRPITQRFSNRGELPIIGIIFDETEEAIYLLPKINRG